MTRSVLTQTVREDIYVYNFRATSAQDHVLLLYKLLPTQDLSTMMVSNILVLPFTPVQNGKAESQSRTSLQDDLGDLLHELGGQLLEPRLVDVLLEG